MEALGGTGAPPSARVLKPNFCGVDLAVAVKLGLVRHAVWITCAPPATLLLVANDDESISALAVVGVTDAAAVDSLEEWHGTRRGSKSGIGRSDPAAAAPYTLIYDLLIGRKRMAVVVKGECAAMPSRAAERGEVYAGDDVVRCAAG